MKGRAALLLAIMAVTGSAAVARDPLEQAEAEFRAAAAAAAQRQAQADAAKDEATRIERERAAAAAALDAAEARLTVAQVKLNQAQVQAQAARRRLVAAQGPAADLLAGLAIMARQPPLMALADDGSVANLVRTQVLLDSTMPAIRQQTRGLERSVTAATGFETAARRALAEVTASRAEIVARQDRLAALEEKASARAMSTGREALGAGDRAIAAEDALQTLRGSNGSDRAIAAIAAEIARGNALAPGPVSQRRATVGPAGYRLPANAPLIEGLGAVDRGGIRARGITLATARGTAIIAPAAGTVRFAGPFEGFAGVIIIEHEGGWSTVLTGVTTTLSKGARIRGGQSIGRALGPIGVELSRKGTHYSPALIAGSSGPLSNVGKNG